MHAIFPLFENGHRSRLNGSAGTSLRAACPLRPLLSMLLIVRDTRLLVDRVSLRPCCSYASTTAVTIDVIGGAGFVDISLVEVPVGVGLVGKGKGGMVGSRAKLSFGAIQSQWWWCVAQQVGERERTEFGVNWIRLQGMGQRGGVGGYLILWVWGLQERDKWWLQGRGRRGGVGGVGGYTILAIGV
eukprot:scaffold57184_cov67-Attheya_sp.AAC.1